MNRMLDRLAEQARKLAEEGKSETTTLQVVIEEPRATGARWVRASDGSGIVQAPITVTKMPLDERSKDLLQRYNRPVTHEVIRAEAPENAPEAVLVAPVAKAAPGPGWKPPAAAPPTELHITNDPAAAQVAVAIAEIRDWRQKYEGLEATHLRALLEAVDKALAGT